MVRRKKPKRGIVLLLVISLLVLFMLIATTYAIVAIQYKTAAVSASRQNLSMDNPRRELDEVFYMLLRDAADFPATNNSPLRSHSLFGDVYETLTAVRGTVSSVTGVAGGQFISINGNAVGSTQFNTIPNYYNGRVFTFITGIAKGVSVRVVGYPTGASTTNATFVIEAEDSFNGAQIPMPAAGDVFYVNGAAFNGTGLGMSTPANTKPPAIPSYTTDATWDTTHQIALLPNLAGYPNYVTINGNNPAGFNPGTTINILGTTNESYDVPDYNNMFLYGKFQTGTLPAVAALFNAAPFIMPSFHRPDLIKYWAATDSTGWNAANPILQRQVIFRPLSTDHPMFTGNPNFTNFGPWDVDNDGDGVADSIWLDPGLPVAVNRDGKRYKRLVAIQVRDMDGKVNINAADCREHALNSTYTTAATWPGNAVGTAPSPTSTTTLPVGLGVGPADITFQNLFNANEYKAILYGTGAVLPFGRYGADQLPGLNGLDPLALLKMRGVPSNYPTDGAGKQASFGSPPDLRGQGTVVLDYLGQPIYTNMVIANETTDSPYETNPQQHVGSNTNNSVGDAIYTAGEMEKVLRYRDVDSPNLPSRLQVLAPNFMSSAANRNLITTHSSHIPVPNVTIPSELRVWNPNNLATPPLSFASLPSPTIIDLYRARIQYEFTKSGKSPPPTVDTVLQQIVPFEMLHGQMFDVNRLFGNGHDNNADNVPDNYEESGTGVLAWPKPPYTLPGNVSNTSNYNGATVNLTNGNPKPPFQLSATQNTDARQLYARHLYCLMRLLVDSNYVIPAVGGKTFSPPNLPKNPPSGYSPQQEYTYGRIAQWAINVVDFRDRDSIMTPFEYDLNPFDGWDVDGNIGVTPSPGVDDTYTAQRRVVWGAESPDLLLTETLAFHDRGVRDTNLDNKLGQYRLDAAKQKEVDPTLDQYKIPQGSLFLELYCPHNSNTNNTAFPMELYNAGKLLELGLPSPLRTVVAGQPQVSYPVWRAVIFKNPPTGSLTTIANSQMSASFQLADLGVQPERVIWFSNTNMTNLPAGLPERKMLFVAQTANVTMAPGTYLVAGPRATTTIGSQTSAPGVNPVASTNSFTLNFPAGTSFLTHGNVPSRPAGTTTAPGWLICSTGNEVPVSPAAAWPAAPVGGVGMNVSEPLPLSGTYYLHPTYNTNYYGNLGAGAKTIPDLPFDQDPTYSSPLNPNLNPGQTSYLQTGTYTDFRAIVLQRLADPLKPWNPDPADTVFNTAGTYPHPQYDSTLPVNPYITVDWSSIDLTVFSGEENTNQQFSIPDPQNMANMITVWIDPTDVNPYSSAPNEQFSTRERGNTTIYKSVGGYDDQLFPPRTTIPPKSTSTTADYFGHMPKNTLGWLNSVIGTPTSIPASFIGAPTYTAGSSNPFPWLNWNNRPFANPLELMLVPASSPDRVGLEYGMMVGSTAKPYNPTTNTNTDYYSNLLNFFDNNNPPPVPAVNPPANPPVTGQFCRLFDFVETPSLFLGTEKWYSPTANFTGDANAATFQPPYNRLSRFRDPGRININTIFDQSVFQSLMRGFPNMDPANSTTTWTNFQTSRQGYASAPNTSFPSIFSQPFRSAASSDMVPLSNMVKSNVEATILRSDPTKLTTPLFDNVSTNPYDNTDRNPYFRLRGVNRLSNLVTTHSNVYAVWITVGYFEVTPNGSPQVFDAAHPDGLQLGQEIGLDSGSVERHRAFYLIDRSIPVAYEAGQDHNVDRAVLIRRYIE